jgi:L-threonine kinase
MGICISVPGSCGELVQGMTEGVNVHITCPIDRFSRATAKTTNTGRVSNTVDIQINRIHIDIENRTNEGSNRYFKQENNGPENNNSNGSTEKVSRAIRSFYNKHGIEHNIVIDIESELSAGKGMASSTADIGAALYAAASATGIETGVSDVAAIAIEIEPTDGILFDGIVLYDHKKGDRLEFIGAAPPVDVIVLEPRQTIDTILFNRTKQETGPPGDQILVEEALQMAKEGIGCLDLKLLGQAASLSARLNQRLLFKPELEDIIEITARKGALGVNVAHSGTVIGIIVESGYAERVFDKIYHYVPKGWYAYLASMIDGGIRCTDDKIYRI